MASPSIARRLRRTSSTHPYLFSLLALLAVAAAALLSLHVAVENVASQTKTMIGHNLDPTPWHLFDRDPHPPQSPATIFRCSYLSCRRFPFSLSSYPPPLEPRHRNRSSCPSFFSFIHRDLEPWRRSGITLALLDEARKKAAMRIIIVGGRLYVDFYYACTQSRAMFTIWGFLQLLQRYPGRVPDVDIMFDCMDKPTVEKPNYRGGGGNLPPAPPLFRYCTTKEHLDIPFPDWSFWGWAEVNIKPWGEQFKRIKAGSQATEWKKKDATAYWKGNPDVSSPIRMALLTCNDTKMWGAQILRQNWADEANAGYKRSDLANQCDHRYKIYAEGYAWSVSLKYILACGSLSLIIDPKYEDFFSRGLIPQVNYLPVSAADLCKSIKAAVDWGNSHPSEAETVGKKAQEFMEELGMERVYDYMYHLLLEYSKLQDFKPTPPLSAQEMCPESTLCLASEKQKDFLKKSQATPATTVPCDLSPP